MSELMLICFVYRVWMSSYACRLQKHSELHLRRGIRDFWQLASVDKIMAVQGRMHVLV
jgi:hypothetical protein